MAPSKNLSRMSTDDLLKLRDEVTTALNQKASELRSQITRLGGDSARRGSPLRGQKVAPKYRSKKDPKLTWAGRGAIPRWMVEEMKAKKLKKDAFLIK
jgi:DNA-binding protein H-NS